MDVSRLRKLMAEDYDPLEDAVREERFRDADVDETLKDRRAKLKQQQDEMFADCFFVYENLEDPDFSVSPLFVIEDYYEFFDKQNKDLLKLQNEARHQP